MRESEGEREWGDEGWADLPHSDVPASLHVQEAWLILVPVHLLEATLNTSSKIPDSRGWERGREEMSSYK